MRINLLHCSLFLIALLTGPKLMAQLAQSDLPAATGKWKLVFSDKFSSRGSFDERKWQYSTRQNPAWARYLTASKDYVQQKSGKLVLRMDKAEIPGDSLPYHSGGIQTSTRFSMLYGKVEVHAKFSKGKGSWPAIWMMPELPAAYGNWPNSGEIDIMEHVNKEKHVHQTIHNAAVTNAAGASTATHQASYKEGEFNTYGIIWKPDTIQFYVNDVLQYTYAKPAGASSREWPFDKPFYLILNQSGGAGWPGPLNEADLPFEMQVDWVKVYQQQP